MLFTSSLVRNFGWVSFSCSTSESLWLYNFCCSCFMLVKMSTLVWGLTNSLELRRSTSFFMAFSCLIWWNLTTLSFQTRYNRSNFSASWLTMSSWYWSHSRCSASYLLVSSSICYSISVSTAGAKQKAISISFWRMPPKYDPLPFCWNDFKLSRLSRRCWTCSFLWALWLLTFSQTPLTYPISFLSKSSSLSPSMCAWISTSLFSRKIRILSLISFFFSEKLS